MYPGRKEVPVPNKFLLLAGLALVTSGVAAQELQPRTAMPYPEEQPRNEGFDSAGALLDALEDAGERIKSLQAGVHHRKFFAIQSDEQERRGTLYFKAVSPSDPLSAADGAPPKRCFAVTFDQLRVGDRLERMEQRFIFDGQWLVEKIPGEKQFTKRQVVPPGETVDPLKIGEGPFPVPIGQKKAAILDRFRAELAPAREGLDDENLAAFAEARGLVQLVLTPREGTSEADDFELVRIWYEPDGRMLPRIAKTVAPVGDESLVVLINPVANEPIPRGIFSTATPPRDEGWRVHVSEYRQPTP
jgi:hypothetical protein